VQDTRPRELPEVELYLFMSPEVRSGEMNARRAHGIRQNLRISDGSVRRYLRWMILATFRHSPLWHLREVVLRGSRRG
jgi:hypothetical protein